MRASGRPASDLRGLWADFRIEATPYLHRFREAHADPAGAQKTRLAGILSEAQESAFGLRYDFRNIDGYDAFAERVPVQRWSDVAPWVERAAREPAPVLTAEVPAFLEPTSGSSAACKLIPYTPALVREFQEAVVVWLAALYDAYPDIAAGPSYWATSPPVPAAQATANGTPVGGASDATYVADSCALPLLAGVLAPPPLTGGGDAWRIDTLATVIEARDLRMLSVWSPTFLITLLGPLFGDKRLADAVLQRVSAASRPQLLRALDDGNFGSLWPSLGLVSCWTGGASERYASVLAGWFPQSRLVPKGLLATEGVVSISYGLGRHCPLALTSHFLEFAGDDGRLCLADGLETGRRYEPVLTTGGGLYRYRLGDVVEYEGVVDGLRCVRFVSRADARCDLVGEKLDEGLVNDAFDEAGVDAPMAALVPDADARPPRYRLLLDGAANADEWAARVETCLMSVHHYAHARRLGQLAHVQAVAAADLSRLLTDAWSSLGRRTGDLKPARLIVSLPFARAIIASCATGGAASHRASASNDTTVAK